MVDAALIAPEYIEDRQLIYHPSDCCQIVALIPCAERRKKRQIVPAHLSFQSCASFSGVFSRDNGNRRSF